MALALKVMIGRSQGGAAMRVFAALALLLLLQPRAAHASLLSPEAEDALATFLALFVLVLVPVVFVVLFWMVHIIPEKVAHKRHHPQQEAIGMLCLLSLVFGGLLWPFALLWAYTKPVLHKMAYGTDLHPRAHAGGEEAEQEAAEAYAAEAAPAGLGLHDRLARLEAQVPDSELKALRADIEALEQKLVEHGVR